jgi:hypothetical protein
MGVVCYEGQSSHGWAAASKEQQIEGCQAGGGSKKAAACNSGVRVECS